MVLKIMYVSDEFKRNVNLLCERRGLKIDILPYSALFEKNKTGVSFGKRDTVAEINNAVSKAMEQNKGVKSVPGSAEQIIE